MLDLRRLEVLCAIARTGSLSAAADDLTYSTPAVWYHVRRLEAEVGQRLLTSHSRGVHLTAAGEVLARHGAQMLERVRRAERELAEFDGDMATGRTQVAAVVRTAASGRPVVAGH